MQSQLAIEYLFRNPQRLQHAFKYPPEVLKWRKFEGMLYGQDFEIGILFGSILSLLGHKGHMKKFIGIAVAAIVIGGWMYFDYTWDERVIKKVSSDGWIPAAVNDKYVIHPWNFIKCSVVGIWFVNPSDMFRFSGDTVIACVMHFDRDEGQSNSFELFDCANKKSAYLSAEELKAGDFSNLKWHSFEPGTPGWQLIEFVSSRLSMIPKMEDKLKRPQPSVGGDGKPGPQPRR